jgi:hypothetical protein
MSEETENALNEALKDKHIRAQIVQVIQNAEQMQKQNSMMLKAILTIVTASLIGVSSMLYKHESRISSMEQQCVSIEHKVDRHENYINILFQRK